MSRSFIPYGHQHIDDGDVAAVVEALRGEWLTQGPAVEGFERAVAAAVDVDHAVAFSSGTAGLHAAVAVADLGPGDLVATSPLTFMASAACARYLGARVGLVDIDPGTLNIDLARVPPQVDGLVAVHYAGLPADLSLLAHRPRVVIEDAAQALGAVTPDGPVGSCARSDMTVFSFHPVKPVTTGEGGVVTTRSAALAERLRAFRSHGIEPASDPDEPWRYSVTSLGFNYRMTDIQAALGQSQMGKLATFVAERNRLAARYRERLAAAPVTLPPAAPPGVTHGYHLFAVQVEDRARVYAGMRAAGIGVQVHFVPVHHHPVSHDAVLLTELDACDRAYAGLLSLPLFPGLADDEQDRVVEVLLGLL